MFSMMILYVTLNKFIQFLLHLTDLIFNDLTDLTILTGKNWSSLFYNTSARHERHKCTTNVTSATRVRHKRHELTPVWQECYTNDRSATRARNFDFDNGTSKNCLRQQLFAFKEVWIGKEIAQYLQNYKHQEVDQGHPKKLLQSSTSYM